VKPGRLVAALTLGCVGLTACADDGSQRVAAGQAASAFEAGTEDLSASSGETVTIQSIDNVFRPQVTEVAPGTEVVWQNRGRNEHDILSDFGFSVAAADFQPSDEYHYVFLQPGEYPYYCHIHGTPTFGMIGSIIVTDDV
jgi:plastocyanin